MRRDYARYKTKRRPTDKVRWRPIALVVSFFVALIAASVFWVGKHQKNIDVAQEHKSSLFSEMKVFFSHKKMNPVLSNKNQKIVIQSVEEDVHFDFYTELPNIQVTPAIEGESAPEPVLKKAEKKSIDAVKANPANVTQTKETQPKQLVIQMGVFSDVASADQFRLSLLLSGFESKIIKASIHGHGAYRVQQGPFANMAQAKNAQKKLLKKGIDSEIKNV